MGKALSMDESLAVPSLPAGIALQRLSKMTRRAEPLLSLPGMEWAEPFFPVPSRKRDATVRQEGDSDEETPEAREVREKRNLREILVALQRTSTLPQESPAPVVLYAKNQEKPKRRRLIPCSPLLEAPQEASSKSFMQRYVDAVLKVEKAAEQGIETGEHCIDWLCNRSSKLSDELLAHMNEAAEIFKQQDTWSILAKIASGILAAISIVFGISLVATPAGGMLVGGLLIASGLLSIVNLIMAETKAWDWVASQIAGDDKQLRDQLRMWIPAGIGMLGILAGAGGSIGALFMEAFNWIRQMLLIGKTATEIAQHIAKMAEGVAHSHSLKAEAETEHLQTEIGMVDPSLNGVIEAIRGIGSAAKKSFLSAHQSLQNWARASQIEIQG